MNQIGIREEIADVKQVSILTRLYQSKVLCPVAPIEMKTDLFQSGFVHLIKEVLYLAAAFLKAFHLLVDFGAPTPDSAGLMMPI